MNCRQYFEADDGDVLLVLLGLNSFTIEKPFVASISAMPSLSAPAIHLSELDQSTLE